MLWRLYLTEFKWTLKWITTWITSEKVIKNGQNKFRGILIKVKNVFAIKWLLQNSQADHPLLVGAVHWNLSIDLLLFIEKIQMNNAVAINWFQYATKGSRYKTQVTGHRSLFYLYRKYPKHSQKRECLGYFLYRLNNDLWPVTCVLYLPDQRHLRYVLRFKSTTLRIVAGFWFWTANFWKMKLKFGKGIGTSLIEWMLVFLRWEFHWFGVGSSWK